MKVALFVDTSSEFFYSWLEEYTYD